MNYGMYLAASGVLTNMYRQDVFANNLANVQTIGFKPDIPMIRQRDPASVEGSVSSDFSRQLLDKLGGGALAGPQQIDFTPGSLEQTNQPLDIAMAGGNEFLAVEVAGANGNFAGSGSAPLGNIRVTRDGRLGRDAQGYLITTADGSRVLNTSDEPIQLSDTGQAKIDSSGQVIQGGQTVAQLQLTAVADTSLLNKQGKDLFGWDGGKDIRQAPASKSVNPGYVESSGVDPVKAMVDVIDNSRSIEESADMIHYHDMLMDRAINTFGRVA